MNEGINKEANEKFAVEFDVEKTDGTWAEYGLLQKYLLHENNEINYKAIVKDGNFINFRSRRAQIIPNEFIREEVAPILEQLGFKPLESTGKVQSVRMLDYYLSDDKVTLKHDEKEEEIGFGVLLSNSIDGSMFTGMSGITYRFICGNGMIGGMETIQSINKSDLMSIVANPNNKDKVASDLKQSVLIITDALKNVIRIYESMMKEEFTKEKYNTLEQLYPEKLLVDVDTCIGKTVWDAYNELTETLWHDRDRRKINQYGMMRHINRVFNI